ncbi:MAG: hemin uptake protein HemP [Thiobacillus sp.]|nr:hemin uptake protein HemP [Thiobacillus sp.]
MNADLKPDLVVIAAVSPSPVHLDSRELFRSGNEVVIVHKGEEYRLRITRNEKLILTK